MVKLIGFKLFYHVLYSLSHLYMCEMLDLDGFELRNSFEYFIIYNTFDTLWG